MPALDRVGIRFFIVVFNVGYVTFIYSVAYTIAELQLWRQLEEGQIQVAAKSNLQHQVGTL